MNYFLENGWEPPPPDCDETITDIESPQHCTNYGGNNLYDIYLANDAVGLVVPESAYPVEPYLAGFSSFMQISTLANQHETVPYWSTHVIAHELHHAIQLRYGNTVSGTPGNYMFNGWFLEQTSTYMENAVFPASIHLLTMLSNCNITSPLTHPEYSIDSALDIYHYRGALWQKFLVESLGDSSIIRFFWENFGIQSSTGNPVSLFPIFNDAIRFVTNDEMTLTEAYRNYALWRYFTGERAIPGHYFNQAVSYCTAETLSNMENTITIPGEKGAVTLIDLSPIDLGIHFFTENPDDLRLHHITETESDVLLTYLELLEENSFFNLEFSESPALIVSSVYSAGESQDVSFSVTVSDTFSLGDVNGDQVINILDVIIQINIILHQIDPTQYQFLTADLDENGNVDILDVVMLVNLILG